MKKKLSRYDINLKIKRCLVSHGSDPRQLTFSFSGKTAWFTGQLVKITGQDMKQEEVEALCKALTAIPDILFMNFELENWSISSGTGAFTIAQKAVASSAPVRDREPLVITTNETVEDVLKETS